MGLQKSLPDILLYTNKLHGFLHMAEQWSLLNSFTLKGTEKLERNAWYGFVCCAITMSVPKYENCLYMKNILPLAENKFNLTLKGHK